MLPLLTATLVLHADPALTKALQDAETIDGARVELVKWAAPRCRGRYSIMAPIEASGRVPVRVRGTSCDEWGWAQVIVTMLTAVATRDVKVGESLSGAWELQDAEVRRGANAVQRIDSSATANRTLRKGQVISSDAFRIGPAPGTPVVVLASVGGITVEQRGTVTPCSGAQVCATLSTGRRVIGHMREGALEIAIDGQRESGGRP